MCEELKFQQSDPGAFICPWSPPVSSLPFLSLTLLGPAEKTSHNTLSPTLIIVYQDQSLSPHPSLHFSLSLHHCLPLSLSVPGTRDDVVITSADCWSAADGSASLSAQREIRDCSVHVQDCNQNKYSVYQMCLFVYL